jgi:signal transduction histidine kinase
MHDAAPLFSPRRDLVPDPFETPHFFLRKLYCIAAISAAIVLAFTGFGVWNVVSHYMIRFAEDSSVRTSAALASSERDSFFIVTPEGRRNVAAGISPDRLEQLDARIRQFLKALDVAKIKIYTPNGRVIYSTDRAIIGEFDLGNSRLRKALSGRIDTELVRRDREQDLAGESKLDVDVVESYVPIHNDDGEVIGCFEVDMDVSRYRGEIWQIVSIAILVIAMVSLVVYGIAFIFLHKIAGKLADTLSALRISQNRQEELGQFIVHDLRSPLFGVMTGLETLQEIGSKRMDSDQTEVLELCMRLCDQMVTLITSLLDLSRLEKGLMPLKLSQVNVKELIASSLEQVRLWAGQKHVALKSHLENKVSTVYADVEVTIRVIVNLLSNAIKFSQPESVISIHVGPTNGNMAVFSIIDQGPGIPGQWADKLFNKYSQLEARTVGGVPGSGLGLAFCGLAVEALGGRIWVKSEIGKGTSVSFTLPMIPPIATA